MPRLLRIHFDLEVFDEPKMKDDPRVEFVTENPDMREVIGNLRIADDGVDTLVEDTFDHIAHADAHGEPVEGLTVLRGWWEDEDGRQHYVALADRPDVAWPPPDIGPTVE